MGSPRWLRFVERPFPSSNMVVIAGDKPVLVDAGYGSDLARTEGLLAERGIGPADLSLVVNTHHHSDHVGGNAGLQGRHGAPVAAHRWEAEMVNRRDPEACSARWLDQPVEPYRVDVPLSDGDEIDAGGVRLEVLHTPGHTLGHVSLWEPEERVLILGDAAHADDVAWINPYREGAGAIGRAMESVERLAGLGARWACSGHGPAIVEPEWALAAARERYEGWLERPESAAWHACKRIAAYALIIRDGLAEGEATDHFASRPWAADFARHAFDADPREFARALIEELIRSGAARRSGGRLVAGAPHNRPPPDWRPAYPWPGNWPSTKAAEERPNGDGHEDRRNHRNGDR
jgi:hydroxyacylglutathione hydrolase